VIPGEEWKILALDKIKFEACVLDGKVLKAKYPTEEEKEVLKLTKEKNLLF
jgi:hypothetical protein